MKKVNLSVFLLFFALGAFSQERYERLGFGVHAGWSRSYISGDHFESKPGFIGGFSANIRVYGNFYVQPEVNFQQQGAKFKGPYRIDDMLFGEAELNMSYLNVPVLLKYRIAPTNLSVYLGPQIGFKLSAKHNVDNGGFNFASDNIKDTDFSGVYGLEYFFALPDERVAFVVNARYFNSFTDFSKYPDLNMPNSSYKNSGFAFTLGLRF
jgi:hypothetical protein